ncbi:sce7725 family protein [Leifsonia shinshuensis]|uniref:Sce7725 family protein n=1 Tax=Leifsonia shinshuensis TaxID=150026 RepID=A0A7G6YAC5_9MICO|nr:sce7725 family protein [Leifsonia shinshuensis]QNE35440.1 sce7725 family protein [Leifsonia shinshuensis]
MYFPYLHGKEGELKALKSVAALLGTPQRIFPILEPVRSIKALERAVFTDFATANAQLYVITNPSQGQLADLAALAQWQSDFSSWLASPVVRPTLLILPTTPLGEVSAFATTYPSQPVGVVVRSSTLSAADVKTALGGANALIFVYATATPNAYVNAFGAGSVVVVRDAFNAQDKNASYSGIETFDDDHATYAAAGRPGFSDFTPMPPRMNSGGGGPAAAIALHMSFRDSGDINVQHFVSDSTTQGDGTNSTKFLEALDHLAEQVRVTPTRFDSSPGLDEFLTLHRDRRATNGAGYKAWQTSHHIITIARELGI